MCAQYINFLFCEKSSFGTVKNMSLVCRNINNFKIQRKSTVPWASASVRFCYFWQVGIFENLRSVFEFCANTFLVTSKKCRWSAVILTVFKNTNKRLYQRNFLNVDDSSSYFVKNIVLEQVKKYHWSPVILTILKFNESLLYHEWLQVCNFPIFGQLRILKICARLFRFWETRFL